MNNEKQYLEIQGLSSDTHMVVCFPESQSVMEREDVELINDEVGLELFGCSAYVVPKEGSTSESNKIIAQFMGFSPESKDDNRYHNMPEHPYKYEGNEYRMQTTFSPISMKYNSSWDWLMPVLKKIDSIANQKMTFSDYDNYRLQFVMIQNPIDYHIEDVHKQVVEFIKWYNEQKPAV